ncbi:MAG TPA: ATP-binding cassette domain-containing protein [Cyclobacteriaceae bacterium]|nr:ATP-binding cassette domain-containing protein [Cyclobacteriaceae bacterium]
MTSEKFSINANLLGKRFNREWVFRNLSLTFTSGATYAIVGPNGSGKSTLMQILWGQMPPSSGNITYSNGKKELEIDSVYKHVSIAAPYMDLIDEFTLAEQLRFHFKLRQSRFDLSPDQMPGALNLEGFEEKYIGNFSSGMKQRVKLGLAMLTLSDAVFLDEPGTNLDEKAFAWYLGLRSRLPKNTLLFIASNQSREYPEDAIKVDLASFK